ncbi:hypothetical protein D3C76_1032610 [compost metagenome]
MHAGRGTGGQQGRQQAGIALGFGLALGTAGGTGAGDQTGQLLTRRDQQPQLGQTLADPLGMALGNSGQQQALPGCHAQGAVALFTCKPGRAAQHRRVQAAQRRCGTDSAQAGLQLGINAQIAGRGQRAAPLTDRCVSPDRQAQPGDKHLWRMLAQQLAHPRLFWPGQVEKTIEHRQHQLMPPRQGHSAQRRILGRAPGQAECQPQFAVQVQGAEP